MKNLLILPDGRQLLSGPGQAPAIQSVRYTRTVCGEEMLDYASACAAMLEVTLIDPEGFTLSAGSSFEYWQEADDGSRRKLGIFLAEQPERPSPNLLRLTAYDRMILLDRDISQWLAGLEGWPYTVSRLLRLACEGQCGVPVAADTELINGEFELSRFLCQGLTARQLVKWIAGVNAAYAYITAQGELAFGRFTQGEATLSAKSLELADYATAPIARVVLRQTADDLGFSYPVEASGEAYAVTGPLVGAFHPQDLQDIADNLARQVLELSYTPGKARFFDPEGTLEPGKLYTVTDRAGRSRCLAAFSVTRSGGISTVESAGSPSRESATALAVRDLVAVVQGRTAELTASTQALSATLTDTTVTLEQLRREQSELTQRADSIQSRVSATEETVAGLQSGYTQLEQTADSLELRIVEAESELSGKAGQEQLEELTEHFLFSQEGLTIYNSATGMSVLVSQGQIAFAGGADPTTTVTPNQMTTTNLTVLSRLDLGSFSFLPRTNGNLSFRYTGGDAT